jgi:hypothetical protein
MQIGPYHSDEIVLCSADAGPSSQREKPDQAQYFFPGAKWVGALRNAAERLRCDFLILTTQHGIVEPHQIIVPYDLHINHHRQAVTEKWHATIPALMIGHAYRLMIFYAGGCPRDEMIEVMLPILQQQRIALLTFGRPNMYDVGKVEAIWNMLMRGTTDNGIKSILRVPKRFEYYPVGDIALNKV